MFDVVRWARAMRQAIDSKDADSLASLMAENDPNGVYSFAEFCAEFGETTRQEWAESTLECGIKTLANLPEHLSTEELEPIRGIIK